MCLTLTGVRTVLSNVGGDLCGSGVVDRDRLLGSGVVDRDRLVGSGVVERDGGGVYM